MSARQATKLPEPIRKQAFALPTTAVKLGTYWYWQERRPGLGLVSCSMPAREAPREIGA